jgi:hypothetical protein
MRFVLFLFLIIAPTVANSTEASPGDRPTAPAQAAGLHPIGIPVATPNGIVYMSDEQYWSYTSHVGQLPVLSPDYVFGKHPHPGHHWFRDRNSHLWSYQENPVPPTRRYLPPSVRR